MKKMTLLCSLICASQLYGMEPEPSYKTLPKELQQEIITIALRSSKDLDEAVNTIKKTSALHEIQYNTLKKFTNLIDWLADLWEQFPYMHNRPSTKSIAEKFDTPIAKKYIQVNSELLDAINTGKLAAVETLIDKQDADPNFTSNDLNAFSSTLQSARFYANIGKPNGKEILEFLLKRGMNPNFNWETKATKGFCAKGGHSPPTPKDIIDLLKQHGWKGE